jgi:ribosomal protein S18 acetylase RimI-like enzyme
VRRVEQLVVLGIEDAGEVLTLQRAAFVPEAQAHGDLDLPPLRQGLVELAAELADPHVLALGLRGRAGRLVAAVRVRTTGDPPEVAEVLRLAVVPDQQGRRLGSRLLAAVEDRLPDGVTELRLFTGEHGDGLSLYQRLGYVETRRELTPAGYHLVHLRKARTAAR